MEQERKIDLMEQAMEGNRRAEVLRDHIIPFIEHRSNVLFQVFCNTPANKVEDLVNIKMQHSVLVALEQDYKAWIDAGKIAQKELEMNDEL